MKKLTIMGAIAAVTLLAACQDDAVIATQNMKKAADNFEVVRNTVFYNTWTDTEVATILGRCSIEDSGTKLAVLCKEPDGSFKRHLLGRSANMTYFALQVDGIDVSTHHTRITWKPQTFIPDVDFRGSVEDLTTNHSEAN